MSNWRTYYRASQAFTWRSRRYSKGEIVGADDPMAERINRERPDLLLITVERTDSALRRPENVAGLRSSPERQPRRDWLAASK
jgi:hypothetical protein